MGFPLFCELESIIYFIAAPRLHAGVHHIFKMVKEYLTMLLRDIILLVHARRSGLGVVVVAAAKAGILFVLLQALLPLPSARAGDRDNCLFLPYICVSKAWTSSSSYLYEVYTSSVRKKCYKCFSFFFCAIKKDKPKDVPLIYGPI